MHEVLLLVGLVAVYGAFVGVGANVCERTFKHRHHWQFAALTDGSWMKSGTDGVEYMQWYFCVRCGETKPIPRTVAALQVAHEEVKG